MTNLTGCSFLSFFAGFIALVAACHRDVALLGRLVLPRRYDDCVKNMCLLFSKPEYACCVDVGTETVVCREIVETQKSEGEVRVATPVAQTDPKRRVRKSSRGLLFPTSTTT